jgi:predicted phosphodiesterase
MSGKPMKKIEGPVSTTVADAPSGPELTVMHLTDTHGDLEHIIAAQKIKKMENIDVTFHTGDFIGTNPYTDDNPVNDLAVYLAGLEQKSEFYTQIIETNEKIIDQLKKEKADGLSEEDVKRRADELEKEYGKDKLIEKHIKYMEELSDSEEIHKEIQGFIENAYAKIKPELEKLGPIAGVLGNHDTRHAYKSLEGVVAFAETTQGIPFKGRTGVDFTVQGNINSWEVPPNTLGNYFAGKALKENLINYIEGTAPEQIPEERREEFLEKVVSPELLRLMNGPRADIFLTHKGPNGKDTGITTPSYCKKVKPGSIYCGHFHKESFENYEGAPEINSGQQYISVVDYGADKKIEEVRVYEIFEWVEEEVPINKAA